MARYLLKRLLIAIPSLLGISVIIFAVLALAPGDPFAELATNPAVPPEVREALRAKFGLDDPIALRYFHWIAAMLHGDWGFSFASRIDVDTLTALRNRHIPVHTVGFGREHMSHDIEIDDALVAPRALADSRLAAVVRFHQRGYAGRKAKLTVRDGTTVLASREVRDEKVTAWPDHLQPARESEGPRVGGIAAGLTSRNSG